MKKKEQIDNKYNIITLGDSGVGKSSILCRYLENKFFDNIMTTMGIAKTHKKITLRNGQEITLVLNDTCGQEKYSSLNKSYLKNADGVLFVFDLSDKKTFNNIKNWINFIQESKNIDKSFPKYLVGNKKDLERDIDKNVIDIFLEENRDFKYKETSAKIENDNQIKELFQEMAEDLYIYASGRKSNDKKNNIKIAGYNEKKKSKCLSCVV